MRRTDESLPRHLTVHRRSFKMGTRRGRIFITMTSMLSVLMLVGVFASAPHRDLPVSWLPIALLAIGIIVGEMLPVSFQARNSKEGVSINFSEGFALAIIFLGYPLVAIFVQIAIVMAYELFRGMKLTRLFGNSSLVTITFCGSWMTFYFVNGFQVVNPSQMSLRDVIAIIVALIPHNVINFSLVVIGSSVFSGQPLKTILVETDLKLFWLPPTLELGLAPMAVAMAVYTPFLVPLLLLPPSVIYFSTRLAAQREQDATHDVLTGLPNRSKLQRLFQSDLDMAIRNKTSLAIMLVDLDHFKEVNDNFGHHIGDALLCEVASRLSGTIREGDLVARLGGDEFALLVHCDQGTPEQALEVAQRIVETLSQPFETNNVRLEVLGSIGCALAPLHGDRLEELMTKADIALYEAKSQRGCASLYEESDHVDADARVHWLGELNQAEQEHQLHIYYQNIVDLTGQRVTNTVACVGWMQQNNGLRKVDTTDVSLAATTLGNILALKTVEDALVGVHTWLGETRAVGATVDITARTLADHRLVELLSQDNHDVPLGLLTLRLSEQDILDDLTRASKALKKLHQLGARLAIRHYGTGYLSVNYLKKLGVTTLFIEHDLIVQALLDPDKTFEMTTTLALARHFGMEIIAESGDLITQAPALRRLGFTAAESPDLTPPLLGGGGEVGVNDGLLVQESSSLHLFTT